VPVLRRLPIAPLPYRSESEGSLAETLAGRAWVLHDPATLTAEEDALERLGLLPEGADLGALLESAYGQAPPVAYREEDGSLAVRDDLAQLSAQQRGVVARELDRAAVDQAFGLVDARANNRSQGDRILARSALELGDASSLMVLWAESSLSGDQAEKVLGQVVPGNDRLRQGLPPIIRDEYEFPYLAGRAFVDELRARGDWPAVDEAWEMLPQTTEQIIHPGRYPDERAVGIEMPDLASLLGEGWTESWVQTMGEARIATWLADGDPGSQSGAEPRRLPSASAADGWGGDRLVSLDGPDGSWIIIWQTAWDGSDEADEFAAAAERAMEDLPSPHAVLVRSDIVGELPAPVLVLVASDEATLGVLTTALGTDQGR
jgi:hypothetical protein